jgi:rhomboid protease GluP
MVVPTDPLSRQPRQPLLDSLRRRQPRLPGTTLLIAANLLVFAAMLGHGAGLWHSPNNIQLGWGANFAPATQDGEWWRLGAALFLHFGAPHLALNMWALWDCGNFVERLYGSRRFLALYALSGLVGNLASLASHGNQAVSAGASGAIFGVLGALLFALWQLRREIEPGEFRWLFGGAAVFSLGAIGLGMWIPGIDNAAHAGGLGSGLLIGIVLHRPLPEAVATARIRVAAAILLLLAVIAVVLRLPEPRYQWSQEVAARREIGLFLREEAAIGQTWAELLARRNRRELSFAELAAEVESEIAPRYQRSFESLSRFAPSPGIPSAPSIRLLQDYASLRHEQSQALLSGLRSGNADEIGRANRLGGQAEAIAQRLGATRRPPQGMSRDQDDPRR